MAHSSAKLKFKLQIKGKPRDLTFFPIPMSNNYQTVSGVSYPGKIFKKTVDNIYDNQILTLINASSQFIEFDAVLKDIDLKLASKNSKYSKSSKKFIRSDKYINGNDFQIKKIASSISGETPEEIIKNSYDFVLDYLDYGYPYEGLYTYVQALRDRVTDCGGFSTLLCSILNAKAIPTRLVVGFLLKNNTSTNLFSKFPVKALSFENLSMHAWVEALLPNGNWFPMDPSIEWRRNNELTKRLGGFGFIPNDRFVVSFGQDLDVKFEAKNYKIEILQHPVSVKI